METFFQFRSSTSQRAGILVSWLIALLLMIQPDQAGAAEPEQKTISASVPDAVQKTDPDAEWHPLLGTEFPGSEWVFFSGQKDAVFSQTWNVVKDTESTASVLVCKGEPHGYLRTRAEYADFDLRLEWRFPLDPNGNSGILLFTSGEDRIWPAALQIQLHQPELGAVFPVGGAKSANELNPNPMVKLAKPVNQWNQCEIRCRNGSVAVIINGQDVGVVQNCLPAIGAIALQSEGSEVHFRAISIREIPIIQANVPNMPTKASPRGLENRR